MKKNPPPPVMLCWEVQSTEIDALYRKSERCGVNTVTKSLARCGASWMEQPEFGQLRVVEAGQHKANASFIFR